MAEIELIPATAPPATPPASASPPLSPVGMRKTKKEKVKEMAKRVKWGLKNVGRILKGRPPRDQELQGVSITIFFPFHEKLTCSL